MTSEITVTHIVIVIYLMVGIGYAYASAKTCSCGVTFDILLSDEVQASGMDEL